jgi:hypothetical protein
MKISLPVLSLCLIPSIALAVCTSDDSVVCRAEKNPVRADANFTMAGLMSVSSSVYYVAKKEGEKIEISRATRDAVFSRNTSAYFQDLDLGALAVGQPARNASRAVSFADAMQMLRQQSSGLTREDKLLTLSEIGSRLSQGYDHRMLNQNSSEALFQNAASGGTQGGICGDIHEYLRNAALALGFKDVGMHSSLWMQSKDDTGEHMVLHFRDPVTQEYYIQNYQNIINTGQKDLVTAVDISTRILAPIANASRIEGRPGVYHVYTPKMARWLFASLDELMGQANDNATLILETSNERQSAGITIRRKIGNTVVTGFVDSIREQTDRGPIELQIMGIQGDYARSKKLQGPINEIGISAQGRLGAYSINAPRIDVSDGERFNQRMMFFDTKIVGWARINDTTGEIEFSAQDAAVDIKSPMKSSTPLVRFKIRGNQVIYNHTSLQAERSYVAANQDYDYLSKPQAVVEYDRVGIAIDTRNPGQDRAYIVFNGDYYMLEGVGAHSAQAVRARLKAVLPAGKLGELSVLLDASEILSNPQDDAVYKYFDKTVATRIKVMWQKRVKEFLTIGAAAEVGVNQPFYLFDDSRPVLDQSPTKKSYRVSVWVRIDLD